MKISVRNKLSGTVKEVKMGVVMAEVIMHVGENQSKRP